MEILEHILFLLTAVVIFFFFFLPHCASSRNSIIMRNSRHITSFARTCEKFYRREEPSVASLRKCLRFVCRVELLDPAN